MTTTQIAQIISTVAYLTLSVTRGERRGVVGISRPGVTYRNSMGRIVTQRVTVSAVGVARDDEERVIGQPTGFDYIGQYSRI
jgi:hypothetical protein